MASRWFLLAMLKSAVDGFEVFGVAPAAQLVDHALERFLALERLFHRASCLAELRSDR